MLDPDVLAKAVATAIRVALAPLQARVAVLEGHQPRDGRDGLPGAPGPVGPPGEKGLDGAPGRDGTVDQLDLVYDGERTLSWTRKDTTDPVWQVRVPLVLDRGVYQAGQTYDRGDGTSWAGSFWIAQRATDQKPGEGDTGWRLAVKRGSEGKPGPKGDAGDRGPKGERS